MKSLVLALVVTCACAGVMFAVEAKTPHLTAVEPDAGKVGDVVTAKGSNLEKDVVAELFLTDGKNDVKVEITGRSGESIQFKVPQIKAGRYRLMTASKTSMIEQPVVYEVNEP